MTTIAIGDIHGRDIWKKIVEQETFDRIVFLGDYFDTHDNVSGQKQLDNFLDIIEYKKKSQKEVILLFGNHDFHYLPGIDQHYSGYQPVYAITIGKYLSEAKQADHLQMCYQLDNIFFSHAGISETFIKETMMPPTAESLNELFRFTPEIFRFEHGNVWTDPYGDNVFQSPIWIRPDSLMADAINGIHIVGHTQHERITCLHDRFWFIDTLGTSGEYLKITDDDVITVVSPFLNND